MALTIEVERYNAVVEEAQPLLERHWEEIANYRDFIPLSPNYAYYAALEAANKLLVITARQEGRMVGYAAFRFDFAAHYSTTLWAENAILWVAPEFRGRLAGLRMIRRAEKELRGRGVSIIQIRSKLAHPELGMLLAKMGYGVSEVIHAKVLQKPE